MLLFPMIYSLSWRKWGPDLWGDLFDKPGGRHGFFAERAVERRQGLDRHGEIGS